ncbi:MAG: lysophospholipid acyltransferase family protein [Bacteroidia bacterium]|nr:lysophospholipid acyltransferase family protein [Bacteroidia bacterium]
MTGYYLLRILSWLIYKMPWRVRYVLSDIFFAIIYYIVGYRRKVVYLNLANSFPEKTQKERELIAKKFYRHICDSFIETLYFDRVSFAEGKNCLKFMNPELLNGYLGQGRQVLTFFGHYNNWEWFCNLPLYATHRCYAVYKKIKSKAIDRFYINLRSRFGAVPLERADTFRQLMSDHQQGIPSMSAFLFDQTPRSTELHHWVTFLNQDTPVILGAEKMAQKLDAVVLFLFSRKIKRGYYETEFQLVTDHAGACPKFEITGKCNHMLEQQIIEHPEFWLWSHKRWKHKRVVTE